MKIKFRILALAMSAMMVLTFMPAMAFAQDDAQEGPETGTAVTAEQQNEEDDEDEVKIVRPVKIEPQVDLYGIVGTNELSSDLYDKGNGFIVTYDDGSVKEFWYDTRTFRQGGEEIEISAFFPMDEESKSIYYLDAYYEPDDDQLFTRGENFVNLYVYPPYYVDGEGEIGTKDFLTEARVWCQFEEPVSLEFIPAEGFMPTGFIGENYIYEDAFYGEGNVFVLTTRSLVWNQDTEKYDEYQYVESKYIYCPDDSEKGVTEGFYRWMDDLPDKPIDYNHRFFLGYCGDCNLSPGINDVQLDYISSPEGTIDTFLVDYEVQIKAEKYDVYSNCPEFEYTGKAITKSAFDKQLVLRNSDGSKVPKDAYTYTLPKSKAIGYYDITVTFDTEKYPDYPETAPVMYRIGPKVPQIKSLKGGKNQITVKWNKLTSSQLKNIDGMYIEIATNKSFTSGYDAIMLNRNQIKKYSKVIKKLKKNKKYYVRVSTFKKIKDTEYGGNYYVFSPDSKIKTVKTKKK